MEKKLCKIVKEIGFKGGNIMLFLSTMFIIAVMVALICLFFVEIPRIPIVRKIIDNFFISSLYFIVCVTRLSAIIANLIILTENLFG